MAIQDRLVSYVQRNSEKKLEEMYGKKIGKTASNGARTFQQKVIGGKTVTTGVSWDNKVISQVSHIGDVIKSTTKKIRYNKSEILSINYKLIKKIYIDENNKFILYFLEKIDKNQKEEEDEQNNKNN
jgi:hypothetical protein